jgi:hypothetical protein
VNREDIRKLLVKTITDIQVSSGRSVPQLLDDTRIIGDLEDFGSLNSIEVTCIVSAHLGFEVDAKLFIPKVFGQPVTLGAAIDRLCEQYEAHQRGGRKHG